MSIWVSKIAPQTTEYCPVVGFSKLRKLVDLGPKTIIFGGPGQIFPKIAYNLINIQPIFMILTFLN